MKKHYSIDQLATATTRQAQAQTALLQRDINKLRDSVAGLTRGIKAPVPKGGSRTIKGSRSLINPLLRSEFANLTRYVVNSAFDDSDSGDGGAGDSAAYGFYKSTAQVAGNALGSLATGQRIR